MAVIEMVVGSWFNMVKKRSIVLRLETFFWKCDTYMVLMVPKEYMCSFRC